MSDDLISRRAAIDAVKRLSLGETDAMRLAMRIEDYLERLSSAQPEIIRCKDCIYGERDDDGRWYCRSLGCQVGNEDGSGFCADAKRREE